ncbi:hypothetical protein NPIL_269701 [Nephila pilipes]|uniref:Uncharacterized protein n=1 Tax=Nephila pilipes TaxID=299642 RepID=A0A8X6UEB1_NEPPI|nr:hypothetical protein NPIL_269701 [Nephila pilipes]
MSWKQHQMRATLNVGKGEMLEYPLSMSSCCTTYTSFPKSCKRMSTNQYLPGVCTHPCLAWRHNLFHECPFFPIEKHCYMKICSTKKKERENPICDLNFRLMPLGTENSTKLRRKNEYFVGVRQAVSEGTAGSFREHFSSGGSRESFVSRTAAVASPPCGTPFSIHPFRNLHHEERFLGIQCKTMGRVVQSAENGFYLNSNVFVVFR